MQTAGDVEAMSLSGPALLLRASIAMGLLCVTVERLSL